MMPQKVKKRRNKSATTNTVLLNARFLSESRILERCRELELAPTEEIGLAKSSYKREGNDKTLHPKIVS